MNIKLTYSCLFFFTILFAYGQRTISGRTIDQFLDTAIGITIFDKDSIEIGQSDFNGYFEINLPKEMDQILFAGLGYEWANVSIPKDCNNLEIILFMASTYDFMSPRKVDRLRKKKFEKIPELHFQAFQKKLFITEKPCVKRIFEPDFPELDKIAKRSKKLTKENKKNFELLEVGDTISIPFNGTYKNDGTESTSLLVYSYLTDGENFDCKIQGVVIQKQKNRKGYFLTYKITNTDMCEYKSIFYNDKAVEVGQIWEVNMKYFKVITE